MFDCAGSSFLRGLFSSCSEQGLLSNCVEASRFDGFFCFQAWAVGHLDFSSCNTWAQLLGHTSSSTCEVFLTQGLNPCLLHWQVDSLPRSHQGSPSWVSFYLEAQETATGPQKTKSEGTSLYCIWYYRKKREKEGRGWGGASRGSIEETVALLLSQVLYLSGLFAVNRNHFYFKQKIP